MQLIKGESSFWLNKNGLTREKFESQDEYFAVSVSESMLNSGIQRISKNIILQYQKRG